MAARPLTRPRTSRLCACLRARPLALSLRGPCADLSKWLQYAPLDADPFRQSAAVWHSYANNACNNQGCWDKTVAAVAKQVPVAVTECGHGVSWAQGLFEWIEAQGGTVSYLPWTWNTWGPADGDADARADAAVPPPRNRTGAARVGGAGEALISDYNGTPTEHWGNAVKSQFAKATVGVPASHE